MNAKACQVAIMREHCELSLFLKCFIVTTAVVVIGQLMRWQQARSSSGNLLLLPLAPALQVTARTHSVY